LIYLLLAGFFSLILVFITPVETAIEASKVPLHKRATYSRLFNINSQNQRPPSPHSLTSLLSVTSQGDVTLMGSVGSLGFNTSSYGKAVSMNSEYAMIGNPNTCEQSPQL
jgi:hypothetical protein